MALSEIDKIYTFIFNLVDESYINIASLMYITFWISILIHMQGSLDFNIDPYNSLE